METFNVLVIVDGGVADRFSTVEEAREAYGEDAEVVIETPEESAEKEAYFADRFKKNGEEDACTHR